MSKKEDLKLLQQLACKYPAEVSAHCISGNALNIYIWCKGRDIIYSSDLVRVFDMSIQSAYQYLNKLYNKGYLMRSMSIAESGGKEWLYSAIDFNKV